MNLYKLKSLDEMIEIFEHENKDFEREVRELFIKLRIEQKQIEEKWEKDHIDEMRGLDGGTSNENRKLVKNYFQKFEELKKKYKIDD